MNRSIPNSIQSPLKCGDNLVIHAPHSFEALGHDLARFTIGRNFFPISSSVADLNGKGKLGGEEDTPPIECANSSLGKRGRIVLQNKPKMRSKLAQIKEERTHTWITSMKKKLNWKL